MAPSEAPATCTKARAMPKRLLEPVAVSSTLKEHGDLQVKVGTEWCSGLIYNFENYSLDIDRQELRRGADLVASNRRCSISCIISSAIASAWSAKTI